MKLYTRIENKPFVTDAKQPVFDRTCDVLVIGAGCAGIFAAVAARREGASVLLIENSEAIGGMHTAGCVIGYYYGKSGGSFEALDEKTAAHGAFLEPRRSPSAKQAIFSEYLTEHGITPLVRHTPTGVYMEGDRVVGVRVLTDKGVESIRTGIVIDATSDGYLLRLCPIKARYGRSVDGKTAPFTVRTILDPDGHNRFTNRDNGYIDQYDEQSFSERVLLAHADVAEELQQSKLVGLAYRTGIREGLCFEGEETLTYADVVYGREPERTLFYAYSDLDRHGRDHAIDEELYQNWWVVSNLSTVTVQIPVPMGAVVPKGIEGIVTAGRCFSSDSYAQSAVRMNRDMFRMGECVGVAAAMAVRTGFPLHLIDYAAYRARVSELGCFGGSFESRFGFHAPSNKLPYTPVDFDLDKNASLLKTDRPGIAVWSAFIAPDRKRIGDRLAALLSDADTALYRYNLSIALGIIGDARALPILREIVASRDCFYFKDCRRSNQFRSAIALCLLGRIGEASDLPLLHEIVFSPDEFERPLYHTLPPDYLYCATDTINFVYFDHFTHAAMALVKLTRRLGLPLRRLNRELRALAEKGQIYRNVTHCAEDSPAMIQIKGFLEHLLRETDEGT